MDLTSFVEYLWAPFVALFYWENRKTKADLERIHHDFAEFRVHVAEDYVHHKELAELKKSIEGLRGDIKELLKGGA